MRHLAHQRRLLNLSEFQVEQRTAASTTALSAFRLYQFVEQSRVSGQAARVATTVSGGRFTPGQDGRGHGECEEEDAGRGMP